MQNQSLRKISFCLEFFDFSAVVLTIFLIIAIIYLVNIIVVACGHKSLYYYVCPGM